MKPEFLPLTYDAPFVLDAVKVYNEYIHGDLEHQEHFFRNHMRRAGYVGLVARVNTHVIGVAFGSLSLAGQWWHDKVATHVGAKHPALQSAWVLTQLNVLSDYRNDRIGTQLHNLILQRQKCSNLLLSTQVANKAAQRFYKRHCWQVLHEGFQFSAGDEPFKILHKTIQKAD